MFVPAARASPEQQPGRITNSILQVGVVTSATRVSLRPLGKFSIVDQETGEFHELKNRLDYTLQAEEGHRLSLGPFRFGGQIRLSPRDAQDAIMIGDKKYHGSLLVRPNSDDTFSVISELGLEEYLYGVLPAEMSADWPLETLKAQAVVARTFAVNNLGKFRSSGFDLSGDSRSQAYADPDKESPRVIEAVRSTEGEVLSFNGEILAVYFHSCCGGHTAGAAAVWGGRFEDPKPLRGVADRYCRSSPEYAWSAYFPSDDILARLAQHGHSMARLQNIRPGDRDWSGFLRTIRVTADRETFELRAGDFRDWMGSTEIKSTKIQRIVRKRNGFTFTGRGFGHGVGLCQWGAYYMARGGRDYRKILGYYFPGAKLAKLDD